MAISVLKVTVDRTHYSRYEPERKVLTARVVPTGATAGDVVTAVIQRNTPAGIRTLDTKTVTLASGDLSGFDVAWDLSEIKDADGFSTVLRSIGIRYDYAVVASAGAVSGSAPFTVVLITAEEMKHRWLHGLPLYAVEKLEPRVQPQAITGAIVVDVSRLTSIGNTTLTYTVSGSTKTLTWGTGAPVTLAATRQRYTVLDARGNYLVVDVDPALLPASSASDPLFIDYGIMSDDTIIHEIQVTTEEVQRGLQCQLEPTVIVSQSLMDKGINPKGVAVYDKVGIGVGYYRPASFERWLELRIPFQPLLKVYELSGYLNRTKIVQITDDWIRHSEQSGAISLVPSNAAIVQWTFYGAGFYSFSLQQSSLPDFWQYRVLAGFRQLPVPIHEFIGERAAISLLIKAQQARYPAGMTSQSVSRDGVSESRGVNPQGAYAATIQQYRQETGIDASGKDNGIVRLRQTYRGVTFTTL